MLKNKLCSRYKWCCFASAGRRHGAQVHPYVFSVSRRVSTGRPATNVPQNQSGDGRRVNAINEATLSRNHNVYSSDPPSSKTAADGITNQKEAKTGDSLPLSRYVDAVVGRYANVEITDVVEVDWDEGSFESSQNGKKARVVYTFDPATCADASGLIRLEENETVFVMQSDMGSGWTFIYSSLRDKTGFVPTTALEIFDSE